MDAESFKKMIKRNMSLEMDFNDITMEVTTRLVWHNDPFQGDMETLLQATTKIDLDHFVTRNEII